MRSENINFSTGVQLLEKLKRYFKDILGEDYRNCLIRDREECFNS